MLWLKGLPLTMLIILAQSAPPDSVVGNSGWASAGIVGLVLSWLLFVHLPAKDKQIERLIDSFRQELKEERQANQTNCQAIVNGLDRICKSKQP